MANISFGSKYFIFSKFSSFPKTSKIEQDRANLLKEYNDYKEFSKSAELKEFEELDKYITSHEFKELLQRIKKNKSAEEEKQKTCEEKKKSKPFKNYFKFRDSQKLKEFNTIAASADLKKLNELKKDSDEYKSLARSKAVKFYQKFSSSQKYKDFAAFEKSRDLADFLALEKYLASDEHKEKLSRFTGEEAAENSKIKQHEEFRNSKKYTWYLGVKDSGKFNDLKRWKLVFEDDFSHGKLDQDKWMTRYFWGDKLVNDAYALEHDRAFPTDGKNIEVSKTLKIVTRKEKTEGKKWKVPFGFVPQEFDFTTGLVSTAKSFRMKYGRVEAKIKVNFAKPVNYNFWMASEHNLPHVDILKLHKKKSKVDVGLAYGKITDEKGPVKKTAQFTGLDVTQDYFIYTLEWTRDKLTWKINDVVVNEQTQGVPHEDMYIVFSSSITENTNGNDLPASMEVDWVRCYQAD